MQYTSLTQLIVIKGEKILMKALASLGEVSKDYQKSK